MLLSQLNQSESFENASLQKNGQNEQQLTFEQLYSFLTNANENETAELNVVLNKLNGTQKNPSTLSEDKMLSTQNVLEELKNLELKINNMSTQENGEVIGKDLEHELLMQNEIKKTAEEDGQSVQQVSIHVIEQLITIWKVELTKNEENPNNTINETENVMNEKKGSVNELLLVKQKLQMHDLIKGQANLVQVSETSSGVALKEAERQMSESTQMSNNKVKEENSLQLSDEISEQQKTGINKAKGAELATGTPVHTFQEKMSTTLNNPLHSMKDSIHQTIKQEVLQGSAAFKVVNPDKIVVQLKPIDLGAVEVTIEKIGGEIHVKMHSDNTDVQNLLDGLADDIRDDLRGRETTSSDEQSFEQDQNEKRREENLTAKKNYGKDELDSSFEERLNDVMGGSEYGHI